MTKPVDVSFCDTLSFLQRETNGPEAKEEFLRLILDVAEVGAWEWDIPSHRVSCSNELYRLHAGPNAPSLSTPEDLYTSIHPEDRLSALETLEQACQQGTRFTYAFRVVWLDGSVHWLDGRGAVERDAQGRAMRMVGVSRDVTEYKRAEQALQENRNFLASAQRLAGIGIWKFDLATQAIFWSEETFRIFGRALDARPPTYAEYQAAIHPEDHARVFEAIGRAISTGEIYELNYRILPAGDQVKHVHCVGQPIYDPSGKVVQLFGTTLDITLHIKAQEALRQRDERLRIAFQVNRMGAWDWDIARDVYTCSEEINALLGMEPGETVDERALAYVHPEDRPQIREGVRQALHAGQTFLVEFRVPRANGDMRWLASRGQVIRDAAGIPLRILGVMMDITERKCLEEQLRHAQKMESVGRLAGGIAHDFNNMLTAMLGFAEMAQETVLPTDPAFETLTSLISVIQRAAGLTGQLLTFARKQVASPRIFDLSRLVMEAERMLGRLIGADIHLITLCDENLGPIKADPAQIEQILINLVVNARDAMPEGGRLIIAAENEHIGQPVLAGQEGLIPGDYVRLTVRDTGVGMSAAVQQRIFEPFFTTKEKGKGTGLGLATCYSIVQQCGGHIRFESVAEEGTAFHIYLPRAQEAISVPAMAPRQTEDFGAETILVAEDEANIREIVTKALQARGYTVLEAADGEEALRRFAEFPGRIDLLVTDVMMPRMDGQTLAERLQPLRPEMRVLYMSGCAENFQGARDSATGFLSKPFTLANLARMVRNLLDVPLAA